MMITFHFIVALMILLDGLHNSKGQVSSSTSLELTSSVDVTSGGIVCPNTRVEFTCKGVAINSLSWQRNTIEIGAVTLFSEAGSTRQMGAFTIFIDSVSLNTTERLGNMTSRLVFILSNVNSTDQIHCAESPISRKTETLNFIRRTAPVSLQRADFNISISSVSLDITFSSIFNSVHNVTFYRVVVTGSSLAQCPSTCLPSEPCQCTRPMANENVTISISADNCEDQEGPVAMFTARATVPSQPSNCSGLPVYNYIGDLTAIELYWTRVDNPPDFTSGVSQDVRHYSVIVEGISSQTVPASSACPTANCSHLVMLSSPSSVLRGSVTAENVFGIGQSCTKQFQIDSKNQIVTLSISTTDPNNRTVKCSPRSLEFGRFECEFCYSPGTSCQGLSSESCITIDESITVLPTLNEVTYCYRATARFNGTSVALIQNTFSVACQQQALIYENVNTSLSGNESFFITGGSVSYSGTTKGSVAIYQCDRGYSLHGNLHRVCQSDGNWDGSVPVCVFLQLTDENHGYLVSSVLLWTVSVILMASETIYIVLEPFSKCVRLTACSVSFYRRSKIVFVSLLILEIVLLLLVVVLWIVFVEAVGKPNKVSQRDSSIIVALVLALLAFTGVIIVPVIIYLVQTCAPNKVTEGPHSTHLVTGSVKKEKSSTKDTGEYVDPNGQSVPDEVDEHRDLPNNRVKGKGVIMKRKPKKDNAFEMPEYDVLAGPGRHVEPHPTNQPTPGSPPKPGQYGTLNMEDRQGSAQYSVPHEHATIAQRYETMSGQFSPTSAGEGKVSTHSGDTQVHEYSVAIKDKKKSRKKL